MTDQPESTTIGAETGPTDIAVLVSHQPVIVLLDEGKRDALFSYIEKEIEAFVPDMTTAKGREECRSLAFKITRTKTAVDKSGLDLTEEAREKIKSINGARGVIKDRLEEMAAKVRAPLTDWEAADEKRQAECKAALERLRGAAIVPMGITSDSIRARIGEVEGESMAEDRWQGMLELATAARDTALEALKAALALVEQKERDEADLARLRAEAAANAAREEQEREDRDRAEREAQQAREIVEREERETQERINREAREEEELKADAEERRWREEKAATAAAENAREEEAARAAETAAETQRAHDAELAAERKERERLEAEQRERERQEQAEKDAREQLERDQARRTLVKREAKEALLTTGITEDQAKAIVLLLISGEIPRAYLDFAAEPKVQPAQPKETLL